MNRMNVLSILICIFFIASSLTSFQNFRKSRLDSGLYIVSNDHASELQLNQTGKFFDVKSLIINIKHITSSQISSTPKINGKVYPVIILNLDSLGIRAIDSIASIDTDRRLTLGLILKGKLRITGEFESFIFSKFKGTSIKIQGCLNDSFDEFNDLKKDFDHARQ